MSLNDKILSCHGNLTISSTAKVLGVSVDSVFNVWKQNHLNTDSLPTIAFRGWHLEYFKTTTAKK